MISLYKRGRVYWIQSTFGGIQKRWSLKTRDRVVADALLQKAQLEELGGGTLVPKPWDKFESEFLAWIEKQIAPKTYKEYAHVLGRFTDFLARSHVLTVKEVEQATITAFTTERMSQVHRISKIPKTHGGVKYDLRILKRVFMYALENGYIQKNPVRAGNLSATPGQTKPFTPDEINRMLTSDYLNTRHYLRAVVLLFLHTGLRISDVVYLKRESVVGNVLTIAPKKTRRLGRVIRVELHPEVIAALHDHFAHQNSAQRESPFVFANDAGRPITFLRSRLMWLWRACGIEKAHAHRFRDTFAVNLLERGASLYDVAKLMGISHGTAELYYAPYTRELQERGSLLVRSLDFMPKPFPVSA